MTQKNVKVLDLKKKLHGMMEDARDMEKSAISKIVEVEKKEKAAVTKMLTRHERGTEKMPKTDTAADHPNYVLKEKPVAETPKAPAKPTHEIEITTPLDDLYKIVQEHGKIGMLDAAKHFRVTEAIMEEWAKMLEAKGLIEINYPFVGKPELKKR